MHTGRNARALGVSRGVSDPHLLHFKARERAGQAWVEEWPGGGFPEDSAPRRALLRVPERPAPGAWIATSRAPLCSPGARLQGGRTSATRPTQSSWSQAQERKPLQGPPAPRTSRQLTPLPRDQVSRPRARAPSWARWLPSSLLPTPQNQESSRKPRARRSSGHLLFFDGLQLVLNERMCLRDWSQNRSGLSILGYCRNPYFFRRKTL